MDDDSMLIEVKVIPEGRMEIQQVVLGSQPLVLCEASEEGIKITMAGFGDEDPAMVLADLGEMLMEMKPDGE